jgi:hypothetical protein
VPIKAQTMGPGTLIIGATGSSVDFTAQVKSCKVTPKGKSGDSAMTLSGETIAGDREYTTTLDATVIQDLSDDGIIDWTWANAGQEVPFQFTPSTAAGKTFTGLVVVDPLEVGGDVGKKNESSMSWECVGLPSIGADL